MKYYLDTEFIEGKQDKKFLGIKYRETPFTIDLISIGIVSEDNREYYAIGKDFNLREAWNRYDEIKDGFRDFGLTPIYKKVYWIRDNVLKPIYKELYDKENLTARQSFHKCNIYIPETEFKFTYKNLKKLINKYGKTNKQIAEDIKKFVYNPTSVKPLGTEESIEFYSYYADYDWVVFCWLFGRMIDLPKQFPMYCRDLKQIADEIWEKTGKSTKFESPKNEHNALSDAKWNKEFHKFLTNL